MVNDRSREVGLNAICHHACTFGRRGIRHVGDAADDDFLSPHELFARPAPLRDDSVGVLPFVRLDSLGVPLVTLADGSRFESEELDAVRSGQIAGGFQCLLDLFMIWQ